MILRAAARPKIRNFLAGLLVASLTALAYSGYEVVSAQQKLSRFSAANEAAKDYLSVLKDAETGYRGYVIAGSQDYLDPFTQAKTALGEQTDVLKRSTIAAGLNPELSASLIQQGEAKIAYGETIVSLMAQSQQTAVDYIKARQGKAVMDAARTDVDLISKWSTAESGRVTSNVQRIWIPLGILSLLGLAISSIAFFGLARRSREQALQARSLLGDVIQRAPIGLALLDSDLRFNQMNSTFGNMLGGVKSSALHDPLEAVAPELAAKIRPRLQEAARAPGGWQDVSADDVIELDARGRTNYYKADVFPVLLSSETSGQQRGAGVVLTDITRQREWEMELEEAKAAAESANRAKSTFLANMSHELRTPLTAVLGYTELIEDDMREAGQEQHLGDLKKININARHLLDLINDVLDLSKIEAQKMEVHATSFTLGTLLSEIEAASGSLIMKKDNTFIATTPQPHLALNTDDLKVKQVLLNLVSNAAKFTEKGEIRLVAEPQEKDGREFIRFQVSDTGIGMTQEQLDNLFQRFNQADSTTTRKYGGTGLGLALTKSLSKLLGGTIAVTSEVGKGSVFTFSIPKDYAPPEVKTAETEEAKQPSTKAKLPEPEDIVLVVDDEASAREILQRHLTKAGFAVRTAANGKEALASIARERPVAVLLDVMMPGMDGWHVLRQIRSTPEWKDIPVIMQTVLNDQALAYALGATNYIKKPVHRHELEEALREAQSSGAEKHALIVDDDVAACERLKKVLTRDGWKVNIAANGEDALSSMGQQKPDLVLVDLIMPGMDGYALIRAMEKDVRFHGIPIVVMTGEDVRAPKVRQLEAQAAQIVQKGSMPLSDLVADLRRFSKSSKAATLSQH